MHSAPTLYGYRNGRTLRPLWALEEIGMRYQYREIDLPGGEGRAPWFLALNPAGKVPLWVDGEEVIPESMAICLHLAERAPDCALLPPPGPERSQCHRWISYLLTEVDAPLWTLAKHRFALPEERRVPAIEGTARWEFSQAASVLGQALDAREFLVGPSIGLADILAGHLLIWARSARLPLPHPALERYLDTLLQRPALLRAQARTRTPEAPP